MSRWILRYEGFDPGEERLREALCTLGNGCFATRGAFPGRHADGVHYPGTYRAGLYDRRGTTLRGTTVENEDLVNLPDWLWTRLELEGRPLDPYAAELLTYVQELDLRRGLLTRKIRLRDEEGRETEMRERRLVSMATRRLAALEITVTPLDWSGEIDVLSGLDGRVENTLVDRYRRLESRHLEPVEVGEVDAESVRLVSRTLQSRIRVAEVARTRFLREGGTLKPPRSLMEDDSCIAHRTSFEVEKGASYTVEKVVGLVTSLDRAISEPAYDAQRAVEDAGGFAELASEHATIWSRLWDRCDIEVEASERVERVVRLYTFHLLQTASEHTVDLDVGVPARGWTGEAYRGHVFWDELFIFPAFTYRLPEVTRSLLMYRYRRLEEARRAARGAGYRGAMFPWQSGSNGEEETQELHLNPESGRWNPDNSQLQRHITGAVAYNVWAYQQITDDREFFEAHGAELMLSCARFWGSIAEHDPERDRYVIRGVMGPDEFHDAHPHAEEPGLHNNAYTNVLAAWTLCRGLEALEMLPERRRRELEEALALDSEEIHRWESASRRMFVPFHDDGVLSQFEGWDDLEELDWDRLREEYDDVRRLDRILESENDTPNRYKASKQADALMLLYLFSAEQLEALLRRLGYDWDPAVIPKMVAYYLDRTSHGSTLSSVVHSWVLSRRDRPGSWKFFRRAVESDVSDIQGGTTPEGIHLGAMAGTVDILQRSYTGLEARGDVLRFNPSIPEELARIAFRARYRGTWLDIEVTCERLRIEARRGRSEAIDVAYCEETRTLEPGGHVEFDLSPA